MSDYITTTIFSNESQQEADIRLTQAVIEKYNLSASKIVPSQYYHSKEQMECLKDDANRAVEYMLQDSIKKYIKIEEIRCFEGIEIRGALHLPYITNDVIKGKDKQIHYLQSDLCKAQSRISRLEAWISLSWYKKLVNKKPSGAKQ